MNIVENIDIKEVIAMQISGYSSAAMLAYRSSGMKQKSRHSEKSRIFLRWYRTQAHRQQAKQIRQRRQKEVSEVDEMAAFKQEIYEELAEIDKIELLGYFVQFCTYHRRWIKRMKEDPAYRKEIMDWLRADARASHGVPFGVHVTTTITGSGATSYGMNVFDNDSAATKASKQQC